ncbi:hypothetical protein HOLleu_20323 [Holothuria leucospilota]|uniref:Uncharacterized protein n=1 Tax=Holothuria leucospilota TaxID=206669 RepID=A0A9Q1C0J7_HOLLE|nr:hypothetical protein HOLleu_20323 [Holothuria leucospilota]
METHLLIKVVLTILLLLSSSGLSVKQDIEEEKTLLNILNPRRQRVFQQFAKRQGALHQYCRAATTEFQIRRCAKYLRG